MALLRREHARDWGVPPGGVVAKSSLTPELISGPSRDLYLPYMCPAAEPAGFTRTAMWVTAGTVSLRSSSSFPPHYWDEAVVHPRDVPARPHQASEDAPHREAEARAAWRPAKELLTKVGKAVRMTPPKSIGTILIHLVT
jgi:hypothetical protein